jgi:uncharacterized protein YndB with AHSA1/START domain
MPDQVLRAAETNVLVDREVTIAAPRELVWAYWTDPARLVQWMGSVASLDLRPGGDVRIEYANGAVMLGTVLEAEPPRRLVFTWGWEDPAELVRPGGSRVEVDLDEADGGTLLRLRHLGLPQAEAAGHAEGWDYFLGRLADAVA